MKPNPLPFQEQLRGFSRALFSTWLYHRRFNLLFDAGEGVATSLLNRVFGIRKILLSHGHADHIAGLTNLINIRNLGAGDQTAELTIYYPRNNALVELIRNYLSQTQNELSFNLIWKALDADERIDLDQKNGKTYLKTFRTQHSQKQLSLGFNIIESRRRLLPEYSGKSQEEINQAIWKVGKDAVAEPFDQIIFTYGGDSRPIQPALVRGTLLLCHECTYLCIDDDERNFQQHSILSDVLETARQAEVKVLLLFHLSLRYSLDEIRETIGEAARRMKLPFRIFILHGDRLFDPLDTYSRRKNRNDEDEAAAEFPVHFREEGAL
ncbi:MAG: MBL fold metallo-hydrolase [Candidatus Riflebacteria bacterium]|nr:MBL fold metallo-hydrolase [Candidatus Riflebacteria bacterium]